MSSSDESEELQEALSSESENEDLEENVIEDYDHDTQNETLCDISPENNFNCDDFVVVKFTCPKNDKLKYYIGKISEIVDKDLLLVNFMRNKKTTSLKVENYFFFPTNKDESLVNYSDVVLKLMRPKDLRRNRYVFENLPNFNIE